MNVLAFIVGALLGLSSLTILGVVATPVIVLYIGVGTYQLFIHKEHSTTSALLGGAIVLELVGTYRPGVFLLLVLVLHASVYLASSALRFTSPFLQYTLLYLVQVSLFLLLVLPLQSILYTLPLVAIMVAGCLVWAYSVYTTQMSKNPHSL